MQVIDNFLDTETFQVLQQTILNNVDFPWFLSKGVHEDAENGTFQFMHNFYVPYAPNPTYQIVEPLVLALQPRALIRIKANFYPVTSTLIQHGMHRDTEFSHHGAILSLNTNNGKTVFETGEEIQSVANRLLIFDPSEPHCSTTCTDDPYGRFNINMNFF